MKRLLACLVVLGGGAVAGCSTDTTLTTDSGVVLPDLGAIDGATSIDAGPSIDAGADDAFRFRRDLGPPVDSGPPQDLGNILPPNDAGDPFGDTGALGDPPWVNFTVLTDGTMCPALVPCGGNVVGTWDVSGGCVAVDLSALMRCPGAMASATGRGRGRVSYDGTNAHRIAQSQIDLQATVPAFCANFVGGCMGLQTRLQMAVPAAACVTQTDGSCYCQAQYDYAVDQSTTYTTMNDEIIAANGHQWAYCVMGRTLTYEDNTPMGSGMQREPGVITLTMR